MLYIYVYNDISVHSLIATVTSARWSIAEGHASRSLKLYNDGLSADKVALLGRVWIVIRY